MFEEWYGQLTDRQWRTNRRHNVSPCDHYSWVATGWSGDEIAGWVVALGSLGESPDGLYGVGWARRWRTAGYTPQTALDATQQVVVRLRSRCARLVWPTDVDELGIAREPSLFEVTAIAPQVVAQLPWGHCART
jgi:hypothetical protein